MGIYHRYIPHTDERAENHTEVVLRLLKYLKPYWKAVAASSFFILLSAISQAAGPFLIGLAIDRFISQADPTGLAWNMVALVGVYLAGMVGMRYQIYYMAWAGQYVLADLRKEVLAKIHRLSLQNLEAGESGDLMSRLINDIETINTFLSQGLVQTVGAVFALLGIVIAMFSLHWPLALAALSLVPVMLLTTRQFARMARRAFRQTRTTIGDVSAELQEELGGMKVAQAYNRSEYNMRRFAERNAANRDANISANAVTSAFAPAMDVLSTLDMAVVAGFGGYLAIQGQVSVGVVVAFLQYVQNFFRPLQTVAQNWTMAQSALAAAERVFELLDRPVQVDETETVEEMPVLTGRVVVSGRTGQGGLTFGYDSSKPVLQDVTLEAEPGQTIALVGPTGAGKSTLVNLLLRFYEVEQGSIWMDDRDIRNFKPSSLRSQMGVVTQDPFLFSGSIMENIRYGRLDAPDSDVIQAAQVANAHDFIMRLPDGYDSQVGERGGLLSLGQRQLIAIARAVLANPRILILDEATASVDTRTEALIQQALHRLLEGRTSFVIAHRLATIRNADQVLVLDDGRIVERGTHDSLLAQNGLYADLYRRQYFLVEEEAVV